MTAAGVARTARALAASLALLGTDGAIAQTPLCAWNGAGLICPAAPTNVLPLTQGVGASRFDPLTSLEQDRQRALARAEVQAELAGAVAAAQLHQAEARDQLRASTDALVSAGRCAEAEVKARDQGHGALLSGIQSACAGRN